MKKRCFCLLLAAVMLITVFPIAARALEGTRIEDIPVTVTAPTLGKTTETAPEASVPADAGCAVTETLWVDEDYKELTVPVAFEADQTYLMEIIIDTEEGYYCTQTGGSHIGTTVTVSGGSLSSIWIVNMSDAQGNPHSTVYVIVAVQAQPAQIAQISLNVTPPTAGTGSTNAKSMIAVTGDGIADYYASWKTFTGYSTDEPTEIDFAEGRTYYGVITLYAAEGYTFKKGYSHELDNDACDYYFGGEVSVTGGELYNNKANVRSVADPEYLRIWITVTAGEAAKCTVSFDPGTGTGEMASSTVSSGDTFELPACTFTHTNAERAFYKWDVGGELCEPGVKITVNRDTVVTATWKYTGDSTTVDNSTDKSTTEVLGMLTLTNTRTGEATSATEYDEVTATSFVNPSNPTVNAMIGEAQTVLADRAGEKAGGSELTTIKNGVESLKVDKYEDNRTFTYSYVKDEAGDYYQVLTIEGTYYKRWKYTVVLEAEYAADETAVKLGDVDFDGNITASDARLALRRAVDLEDYAPGSREFIACDVDMDHNVTSGDARMILRGAVGLEDPDSWGK